MAERPDTAKNWWTALAQPAGTPEMDAIAQETALNRGILLFSSGDYRQAAVQLEPASASSALAAQYLALSRLEMGETTVALVGIGSFHQLATQTQREFAAGVAGLEDGNYAVAAAEIDRYVQANPGDAYAHLLLAHALIQQQEYPRASAHLDQARADGGLTVYADHLAARLPGQPLPAAGFDETGASTQDLNWSDPQADRRWNFTVITGYQYDSNVVLSPDFVGLGAPTNMADSSWFIASFGDYRLIQEEERSVGLIMSTYDNFYFNQTNFDLQDYMGGMYYNALVGCDCIVGVRYELHETLLDYRHFSYEHRLVPNLTYREGDFGHTTVYYEFDAAEFDLLPLVPAQDRDARVHAVGVTQAIYTWFGLGRVFLGYRFEGADADGSDFDRSTNMVTARLERPLGERMVLDAEVRQFWDGYENPNSLDFFGRRRSDQRTEVRTGLQWYFGPHASLRLDYSYISSNSNVSNLFGVEFFDYDRHLLTPQFIYDF